MNSAGSDPFERMLHRADDLHERMHALLERAELDDSSRGVAASGMCLVALEHGTALRALMALRLPTSAVSLMRLQFEALTRALWLMYAASDEAIRKLLAPLTSESEQAAKNMPSASHMIEQIGRQARAGAPAAAHQMLSAVQGCVVARHELVRPRRHSSAAAQRGGLSGSAGDAGAGQLERAVPHDRHGARELVW